MAAELERRILSQSESKGRTKKRETLPEKSARARAIAGHLARLYPDVECPLTHRNTFELLAAVILSAQCTDAAVNKVTPELFRRYPDPASMARAATSDIESIIRRLGLFRAKAKSLQRCAEQLVAEFGGPVPSAMEDLIKLAGVGEKRPMSCAAMPLACRVLPSTPTAAVYRAASGSPANKIPLKSSKI